MTIWHMIRLYGRHPDARSPCRQHAAGLRHTEDPAPSALNARHQHPPRRVGLRRDDLRHAVPGQPPGRPQTPRITAGRHRRSGRGGTPGPRRITSWTCAHGNPEFGGGTRLQSGGTRPERPGADASRVRPGAPEVHAAARHSSGVSCSATACPPRHRADRPLIAPWKACAYRCPAPKGRQPRQLSRAEGRRLPAPLQAGRLPMLFSPPMTNPSASRHEDSGIPSRRTETSALPPLIRLTT